MTELRKEGCNEIGFVDPYIVFKDQLLQRLIGSLSQRVTS